MKKTSYFWIILAFLVVVIPLSWGLYRSVMNSKPLFMAGSAPAAAAPTPAFPAGTVPVHSLAPIPPTRAPDPSIAPTPTLAPVRVKVSAPSQPAAPRDPNAPISPDS